MRRVLLPLLLAACAAGCVSSRQAAFNEKALAGKAVCVETQTVEGRAPSLLPEGFDFKLVWHDEFDGDRLDTTKWSYRTNFWGQRFPAFADGGVTVSNSCAYLNLQKKGGQYCSPHLQTGELVWDRPVDEKRKSFWPYGKRPEPKFTHRYGYYECRCKLQQNPGWWSAFWMQSPSTGASLDPEQVGVECDIMESFEPGRVGRHMLHYNGYGADYGSYDSHRHFKKKNPTEADVRATETDLDRTKFHTFGVLWEPDGYTFFINGKQSGYKVGHADGKPVSAAKQFILISTECKWYRQNRMTGAGVPELDKAIPDCFTVDHVRVYDKID